MTSSKKIRTIVTVCWILILLVYWYGILRINFAGNPGYYCSDMYSDIIYSMEAWNHKSLFPTEWVFGNQLYAVATPVMAAIFYGLTNNPMTAMGIAATVMGLCVILSFVWMLRPIIMDAHERLACVVVFMAVILLSGNPVLGLNGWQLFFTMCAYYSCYAITVFFAFGCYFRQERLHTLKYLPVLLLTCFLSFATGVQSLRQTLIMVLPMIALSLLKCFHSFLNNYKLSYKSFTVTGLIACCNFAGILTAKCLNVKSSMFMVN